MENYVAQDYFEKFDNLLEAAKKDILTNIPSNLNALFQLLLALPLFTDTTIEEIENYKRALNGNKHYSSFKDLIILHAIKKNQLKICSIAEIENRINNHSAFYFFNNAKGKEMASSHGVAVKDNQYNGETFYEGCTVADFPLSRDWQAITEFIPPCNSMFIVDKYVFGYPFEEKINGLTSFVKLYKAATKIPFHLTIVFSQRRNERLICTTSQINSAFTKLKAIGNIEVQLFSNNSIPSDDRIILTNYCSGNIGHPFDGRRTRFNQNFLGRENIETKIIRNYRTYKTELRFWNSFINNIPNRRGEVRTKWTTSEFTNRLFHPII